MRLYFKYLGIQLRCQMQHKSSFLLNMLGQALTSLTTFLGVYFMFLRFHTVAGFSFEEVLLCFATVLLSFSAAECFGRGFDAFSRMLGNGQFDRVLVRPRNEVFQVLGTNVDFTRLGRFLEAVVVFVYAIPRCGVVWTWDKVVTLALMLVCGAIVFVGLFIVYAALCFFTTEGLEFINIFTDGGREFGRYPFSVYGEGVLKFFTFVVPLALFQYYPLMYLLGRADRWWYCLLPPLSTLFLIPCLLLWKLGVRHFRSTGS
ncbi:MAG TPA: ABC-2 family transporter protein [Clostridia bacterium]|nr:ABC-2 family transporter protein [Clostridia bacterium]